MKLSFGKIVPCLIFLLVPTLGSPLGTREEEESTRMNQIEVKTESELESNWGNEVVFYGIYEPMLLPKSKRPGSPLVDSGRIQIRMGKHKLALEVDFLGFRDIEESDLFLNQRVKVTGTPVKWAQLWGNPDEQAIVMSALLNIKQIERE